MEPAFLKERLERFLKIVPIEYKIADPIKKSPKGFTTTLERDGKAKYQTGKVIEETTKGSKDEETEEDDKDTTPETKSKKKSLDELIDGGMI